MLARHTLITTLDIGTSNTTAVIAEVDSSGYVELLGHGQCLTAGFEDDRVTDISKLGETIAESVGAAEDMADLRAGSLVISIGGEHARIMQSRGGIPLHHQSMGHQGRSIGQQDIKKAIDNAGTVPMPADLQVLHVLPLFFKVDGQQVKNPEGVSGTRLEVEVMIIAASQSILRSIIKAAEYNGYRVRKFCYRPLATSRAVLSSEEMDLGTCMMDIGGRYTDVAVFKEGKMLFSSTLAVGGEHLTDDTVCHLEVNRQEAESIKVRYGHCNSSLRENREFQITGPGNDGSLWRTVCQSELGHMVMQPRVEEIMEEALVAVCHHGGHTKLPGGAVLTGGGSQLPGLQTLAATIMPFQVVAGENIGIDNLDDESSSPGHATALGLILFDMEQRFNRREEVRNNPISRFCGSILRKIHTVM